MASSMAFDRSSASAFIWLGNRIISGDRYGDQVDSGGVSVVVVVQGVCWVERRYQFMD